MRAFFLFVSILICGVNINAQSHYFTDATYKISFPTDFKQNTHTNISNTSLTLSPSTQPLLSQKIAIPLEGKPFITAALQYDGPSDEILLGQFAIRFSQDGQNWQEWIAIHEDMHIPDESRQSIFTGQLIFAQATDQYFQMAIYPKANKTIVFNKVQIVFSAPGESKKDIIQHPQPQVTARTVCPIPSFQGRSDWCSLGECPFGDSPYITSVTHLIVHHSAGTNTSSDWPAVVRAIWHYHVDTHGWDDIGYNWLIDANGILYQGRPDNVRGAHFSGHNTGTMGVCVLGNFHDADPKVSPKLAAIEKLEYLLCWKSEKESLNPLATVYHPSSGLNLKVIAGHRDSGSGTSCPGDSLYIQLPAIRIYVDSLLNPVSIFEASQNSGLIGITPTLAQNSIQINYLTPYQPKLKYQIFSTSGKIIQQSDFQGDKTIDIINFPKGMFFIRVIGKETLDIFRIIKN